MEPTDNERTVALLRVVLPNPRWENAEFLDWVYDHNPLGPVVAQNLDRDDQRVCHIGGVPVVMRSADDEGRYIVLFNSSSAPSEQGTGTYVKTLSALIRHMAEIGLHGGFGVTNASSTGPANRGAKAHIIGPLPAKLCVPTVVRSPGFEHVEATPEFLQSERFVELTRDLDDFPADAWTYRWTTEYLRWRLSWPRARYWIHVGPELFAVTTRTSYQHVPLGVLLKVLPRGGRTGPLSSERLISAVCKFHRVPALVYAGYNANVPVKGFRLKQERLPSPLNLMFQATSRYVDNETMRFDTFEFLEFDAY